MNIKLAFLKLPTLEFHLYNKLIESSYKLKC